MEMEPKIENKSELPQEETGLEKETILGVNEYLQKEAERTGEKFPPVFIKFFSGAHSTEYDARGIPKELEGADIYIPEYDGWTEEAAQKINNISFGTTFLEDPDRGFAADFLQPTLKALAFSGKPIVFIDLPKEKLRKYEEENKQFWDKRKALSLFKYEEATKEMRTRMKHTADFHKYREGYMKSALGPKIAETLRKHPELCEKERVTALITLDVAHTDIYHQLKKAESETVSRKFSGLPLYGVRHEAIRRFMFGKEIDDELVGKMLIEEILETEYGEKLRNATSDSLRLIKAERMFAEIFEGEEKAMFEKWKESENEYWEARKEFVKERGLKSVKWRDVCEDFEKWRKEKGLDTHDFSKYFDAKLLEKGIKMPTNEKELDELLAGKYGKNKII